MVTEINSLENFNYEEIGNDKNLIQLNSIKYKFLYKGLVNNNAYFYLDRNKGINFCIKIKSLGELKNYVSKDKSFSIGNGEKGPEIVISFIGTDNVYVFGFNIESRIDKEALDVIVKNKKINIHYFVNDSGLIKLYSETYPLFDEIIESIAYMMEFSENARYPRIKYDKELGQGYYLKLQTGLEGIEEVLKVIELLQKWSSLDEFDVFLDYKENLYVFFSEGIKNIEFIKKELEKKLPIIEEGRGPIKGKPFVKYKNSLIYFYE